MGTQKYESNWESLQQYTVPQWFKDAKLGIFIHWGIYSVPAFDNEWYPNYMYHDENSEKGPNYFQYHIKNHGHPSKFGYKDFIPHFKAENWDPTAWVELFKEAGARYIVPVAEHHDGFPMYATDFTEWNAAKMGPCRDVITELGQVARQEGLKFGMSSHRAENWHYYTFLDDFDTMNPANSGLYGLPHPKGEPSSPAFIEDWLGRTKELIDKFRPDLIYFDIGWHTDEFAPYRPQVASYYYNRATEWNENVVLTYKDGFPEGTAVLDVERGKLDGIREKHWQADTSVSYKSWSHIEDDEFKSVTTIVHDLVDVVSKNGNLLLNVGPKADGTISNEATGILRGLGAWLKVNAEAIYDTQHWHIYGEGSTKVESGQMTERKNKPFTARDVRFTTKDDALYAICMGWPDNKINIKSLKKGSPVSTERIAQITMLGSEEGLEWSQDEAGLQIKAPASKPCDHAYTYKIVLKD